MADLAVNGKDLIRYGLKPGPRFGRILEALLERVLEDPTLNDEDVLMAMAAELAGAGE